MLMSDCSVIKKSELKTFLTSVISSSVTSCRPYGIILYILPI